MARFLTAADTVDPTDIPPMSLAPDAAQMQALRVTHAIVASGTAFRFAGPWQGLERLPKAGTLIGWDEDTEIVTPYDDCVLIMPSLVNLRAGNTVVRLAQPFD